MTINNNYNFGLLSDDGTTSTPTSLQNLKSFTLTYNQSSGLWEVTSNLKDYAVMYYNTNQSNSNGATYNGLIVYNAIGNNFVILVDNLVQSQITQANFVIFGTHTKPTMDILEGTTSITYPELPTFINGNVGYNIPNSVLNSRNGIYTFYIMD